MYLQNGYLYIEDKDIIKTKNGLSSPKKITGHSFVQLCGKDNFVKKGDAMLYLLRILQPNNIDPYYTLRGDIAEQLVHRSYVKKGHKYEVWDKKSINYDNFKDVSQIFGGLIDGLADDSIIVEVKSKSMKDYRYITENGVESEELQGEYYAVLKGLSKVNIEWVFFTQKQEEELRQTGKITNWIGCLNYQKKIDVNVDYLMNLMKEAAEYYQDCISNKRIPVEDISEDKFKILLEMGLDFNDGAK